MIGHSPPNLNLERYRGREYSKQFHHLTKILMVYTGTLKDRPFRNGKSGTAMATILCKRDPTLQPHASWQIQKATLQKKVIKASLLLHPQNYRFMRGQKLPTTLYPYLWMYRQVAYRLTFALCESAAPLNHLNGGSALQSRNQHHMGTLDQSGRQADTASPEQWY